MNESETLTAMTQMPAELAVMKMENENIQALAAAHPRNHASIREDLLAQIQAYPSFAKTIIYAKPVGKDPDTGLQKFARGLSIRAAEALAAAYRYNRVSATAEPVPGEPDLVKVTATFVDYQTGRIWQDSGICSKMYKTRYGKMERWADDRFNQVVVKAELSRRIREVILRCVPPGLRSELMEAAEQEMAKLLTDSAIEKIAKGFAEYGIDIPALENYLGRTLKAGWTQEDKSTLLGLWNALREGEVSAKEILADLNGDAAGTPPKPEPPKRGRPPKNVSLANALTNPQEAAKGEVAGTTEEPPTAGESPQLSIVDGGDGEGAD